MTMKVFCRMSRVDVAVAKPQCEKASDEHLRDCRYNLDYLLNTYIDEEITACDE